MEPYSVLYTLYSKRERLLPWRVKSNGFQDKDFFQATAWPYSHSQRENQIKSILYKDTDGLVLHSERDVHSCELWGLSGAKLSKSVKDSILDQESNVRISCKWPFVAINRS